MIRRKVRLRKAEGERRRRKVTPAEASHMRPERRIEPTQQAEPEPLSPGMANKFEREPQPLPPHVPHSAGQQPSPPRMPPTSSQSGPASSVRWMLCLAKKVGKGSP